MVIKEKKKIGRPIEDGSKQIKKFEPHPAQWDAFNFKTQFGACICGSQSGKTTVGAYRAYQWINDELQKDVPRPGLIGAPTYKILQQSTLFKFWEQFPWLRQYYKKQENIIDIPYTDKKGKKQIYTIFVRSFDRPLGVEGMSPGWAWLDEFGQCSQMSWIVVKTRMTVTKGKIFITTTPYNMGFLYHDIYLPAQNGDDPRISVFTWSSWDNPYADKEHLKHERKVLSPEEYARRYEGKFTRMSGLVYNITEQHRFSELPKFDKVIGGMDWGWHRCAISVIGVRHDGYYIIDEYYETEKTTDEMIEAAKEFQETYHVSRWYADSASPEKIAQAKKGTGLYVLGYKKKKDSISHGASFIRQLINEHQLWVHTDCKYHMSEFDSYHYPEEIRPGGNEDPVKENDHLMDAMRYAIMGDKPVNRYSPRDSTATFDAMFGFKPKRTSNKIDYQLL